MFMFYVSYAPMFVLSQNLPSATCVFFPSLRYGDLSGRSRAPRTRRRARASRAEERLLPWENFLSIFWQNMARFRAKKISNSSEIIWVVQLHISSTSSPGVVWIRLRHRHISDELIRAVSFYLSVAIFFLWHRNFLVLAKKKWILVVP